VWRSMVARSVSAVGVASVRAGPVGDQGPLTILHMVQGHRLHLRSYYAQQRSTGRSISTWVSLSADVQVLLSCAIASCFLLWLASQGFTMSMGG